jgi:hypothetical protein
VSQAALSLSSVRSCHFGPASWQARARSTDRSPALARADRPPYRRDNLDELIALQLGPAQYIITALRSSLRTGSRSPQMSGPTSSGHGVGRAR